MMEWQRLVKMGRTLYRFCPLITGKSYLALSAAIVM